MFTVLEVATLVAVTALGLYFAAPDVALRAPNHLVIAVLLFEKPTYTCPGLLIVLMGIPVFLMMRRRIEGAL